MALGDSIPRVDAYDKITGRCKYTDDLCPKNALIARVLHASIAHGMVKSIDISEAEKIPGVVKIVTCFDVPDIEFRTPGHPWSLDPAHQDKADRKLLNQHIRYYGDDIAAVVAENDIAAVQALRAIKVEYEEYPFVLDVQEAIAADMPPIHDDRPDNVLAHSQLNYGDYDEAIKEPGLIKVEGWYNTPTVQHCHIENFICYSYMEGDRIVIQDSTQIPHIIRRIVGQALGIDWGKIRVIKSYLGGGFGNKQDALYEPLCAYLCTQVGGRLVKLDVPREETFVNNRVRHAVRMHITSWLRPDGTMVAHKLENYSNQGGYASHGHAIAAKGMNCWNQMYPCPNTQGDAYTVYTNRPAAGAMRGYGIPQAVYCVECHAEDIARALGMSSLEYRMKYIMPAGYVNQFDHNENYYDSFRQCLAKGRLEFKYDERLAKYQNQTGDIRRGVGMAAAWYTTAVYPIALESVSCRMVVNQDGSIQVQVGETEIGQGADTAYTQMAAAVTGIPENMVHVVSNQDTDVTPFGLGAYASRQTFSCGFGIKQTGILLKQKILSAARIWTRMPEYNMDVVDGKIIRTTDGRELMTVGEVAIQTLYSQEHSQHITAESTYNIKSNAYTFSCCYADVEVDIPACKATLKDILNVHDCGALINPALAEAQVHGGQSMVIGMGLTETLLFDQKTGRVLNPNLLDYKISTMMDHPSLRASFIENYEPTSAYGTKGLGEPPACPVAPAIRNAILQATGVAINECPARPQVLFPAFKEAGLI